MDSPVDRLRAWLPHVLLLGAVATSVLLLVVVVWPLRHALVLAGSVALLTYPLAFVPVLRRIERAAPHWDADQLRFAAAAIATTLVGVAGAVAVLVGLWLVFGSFNLIADLLHGVIFANQERLAQSLDALMAKLSQLMGLYPQIPWDPAVVRAALEEFLGRGQLGPDMLGFLFRGTIGVLATSALTLIALFYLYAQGTQLAGQLMRLLPLTPERRAQLGQRFHHLATYVAAGVVLRALAHGVACGLIAWGLAGANPIATGAVATFLSLLPVVGPAIAWVPYATVLWSTDRQLQAALLAVACMSSAWVVELAFRRLAQRLGADSLWFGFLLFCGLIGGIASLGLRGIIVGPAAALTAAALFSLLPAVYGVGRGDENANGRG